MSIFKASMYEYPCTVDIGDEIEVDNKYIKVLAIIKVDFIEKVFWFSGVPINELD